MSKKIRYIHKQASSNDKRINPELVKILGNDLVLSLLEDFKKYAHEVDQTPLTGTFS